MNNVTISNMDLQVGDIVHFQGARFAIVSTKIVSDDKHYWPHREEKPVMVAMGKWLDGEIVPGYFGPDLDWNFQGNELARRSIEARASVSA